MRDNSNSETLVFPRPGDSGDFFVCVFDANDQCTAVITPDNTFVALYDDSPECIHANVKGRDNEEPKLIPLNEGEALILIHNGIRAVYAPITPEEIIVRLKP